MTRTDYDIVVVDDMAVDWVGVHNDWLVDKIIKQAETFSTNNSLMVCTPSTNSTQIYNLRSGDTIVEDRTMTNKLANAEKELNELRNNLDKEARKLGHRGFLTAEIKSNAGRVDWSLDREEFDEHIRRHNKLEERFNQGKDRGTVEVAIRTNEATRIRINDDLLKEINEFTAYINENYVEKMRKLRREIHLLHEQERIEKQLDKKDDEDDFFTCMFGL